MVQKQIYPDRILIFGDSILKGVRYEDGAYRVDHSWQTLFSERFKIPVENFSRFGNTIGKAMQALRRSCTLHAGGKEIALLELGGNDCDYNWSEISDNPEGIYHCRTVPEQFSASYREAISLLRESGREPVVLTLPPIHSERYLDFICSRGPSRNNLLKWLGKASEIAMWQKTYSCLVRQIAREEGVRLIDLRGRFPAEETALEGLLGPDGIHPSAEGQKLIFETLCEDARQVFGA